uniref:Uncharacterized protein n=1 Tax=Eptatretus burgeri TaxID=7764 RepID=A0A8C4QWP9_EPTBU
MITEIRSTYKAREEQLARAVRSYKKRMHNVVVQHQQLLAAYRLVFQFHILHIAQNQTCCKLHSSAIPQPTMPSFSLYTESRLMEEQGTQNRPGCKEQKEQKKVGEAPTAGYSNKIGVDLEGKRTWRRMGVRGGRGEKDGCTHKFTITEVEKKSQKWKKKGHGCELKWL